MASVFKPKGKSKYVIFYTDETGRRRKKAGATDKAVTQRLAAKLENDVALRKQGLIDPTAERLAHHDRRPIREHLDDFIKTGGGGAVGPRSQRPRDSREGVLAVGFSRRSRPRLRACDHRPTQRAG